MKEFVLGNPTGETCKMMEFETGNPVPSYFDPLAEPFEKYKNSG